MKPDGRHNVGSIFCWATNDMKLSLLILVAVLLFITGFGCKTASFDYTTTNILGQPVERLSCNFDTLTKEEALKIAETMAAQHGYKLSDYQSPKALGLREGQWLVYFEMKPPVPAGGFFHVVIDRETKQVTLIPGS